MTTTVYDLTCAPFVIAVFKDGHSEEMGIRDIFSRSEEIYDLGGDTPFQRISIIRLLLAILYRTYKPVTIDDWFDIWTEESFDMNLVNGYLDQYEERFNLLSPITPFYQVLNAEYENLKTEVNTHPLFLDASLMANTDLPLYSQYRPSGMSSISYPAAARRIVEIQNFCTGSKASILKGDTRRKKRGYREPGWGARGLIVSLRGANLAQTLKLNLVPYGSLADNIDAESDLAVWEREQQTTTPEGLFGDLDESRQPMGPADLYTYQPSRITLMNDPVSGRINNSVVGIGDRLTRRNRQDIEPMMPQRKKVDKETGETWNPYKGSTDVSAWQILDVVVASEAKMQNIHQVPKVVSFFGEIEEHISSTMAETVTIDVFAANYGAQDAIIDSVLITNTTLPIRLFDKSQPELLVTSIEAVRVAKEGVWWYTRFLGGVSSLHSRKKEMPRADLRSSTIFELEQKFNLWILNLKTENLDEKIREWDDIVISHLLKKMDADVKTYGVPMMRIRARDETGRNIFNLHNMYAATLRKKLKRSE